MRTHGTLTRWNDDRGFGFITPAKGAADVFVHISAFPRDGVRPRLNELISFETEAGRDGKPRAVQVVRAGQRPTPRVAAPAHRRKRRIRRVAASIALWGIAGVAAYAITRFIGHEMGEREDRHAEALARLPSRFHCDGRTMCSHMTSCDEATYFIRNCPNTQMDGDSDGIPCESQWCH